MSSRNPIELKLEDNGWRLEEKQNGRPSLVARRE